MVTSQSYDFYQATLPPNIVFDTRNIKTHFTDYGLVVPMETHTPLVNIDGIARRTIGQPVNAQHKILMFGNSSLFGFYIPDSDTIPSRLQALMPSYKVINYSWPSYTVEQQTIELEHSPDVQPGDIVIFYDGINEAVDSYTTLPICDVNLGVIKLLCTPERNISLNNLDNMRFEMVSALLRAVYYTIHHNAIFIHVLQPHIWSMPLTSSEQILMQKFIDSRHFKTLAPIGNVWSSIQSCDPNAVDLTHLLDAVRSTTDG